MPEWLLGLVLWLFYTGFMITLGAALQGTLHRAEALRRGYAQYSPKTGIWEWKEPADDSRG